MSCDLFSAGFAAGSCKAVERAGVSREEAHFLAMYTAGCPQKAQILYDSKIMDRKNDMIDQMVFGSGSDALLKKIGSDKDATKELLDVLLSWHRDLLLIKSGARENQLVHIDRLDALARAAQAKSFDEIKNIINEIVRAAKQLSDNLNVKVALMVIKERVWVK